MPHARRTPAKHENTSGVPVRVPAAPGAKRGETVTKPVSFRVARLRKLLKTKNFTEYRYGHPCRDRLDEVSIFYLRSSTNQSIIVHTLETNILPSLCFGKYRTPFALSLSKGGRPAVHASTGSARTASLVNNMSCLLWTP